MALAEAASASIPIVCSNIPTFKEMFSQDEVAFFDVDNLSSLTIAIRSIVMEGEKKANLALINYNKNYTGLPEHNSYGTDRHICTEYNENEITDLALNILKEHGIDINVDKLDIDVFLKLLIDFIKLSLPDLVLEEAAFKKSELREIPAVNGWWNDELNVGFGYGLYD